MNKMDKIIFWVAFFFFVVFFASNAITNPMIYFFKSYLWTIWIFYVWLVWVAMWWGLRWMLNWKGSSNDYDDEWDWF